MADTYLEITQQIEKLKQKAESVRAREIDGVIERIRTAIQAYGLTSAQLFGGVAPGAKGSRSNGKAGRGTADDGSSTRYVDEDGHRWSGRGPRPGWVKAALAAGKTLDDLKVAGGADLDAPAAPRKRATRRSAAKAPVAIKYRDDAGHSWSGRGPRPRWFKAAIDAGKTVDELASAPPPEVP